MVETLLLIIMAAGIGLYQDINKPTQFELNMEDGTNTEVVLQKNSSYSCPVYCEADHIHIAVSCEDNCKTDHKNYHLHNVTAIDEGFATFCSKKIITMNKISTKKKLPDILSTSKSE